MKQVCLHSCDISINRFNRPLNDLDSSDAIARFCMFTETFEPIYLALYITVQQIRLFVFDPTFFPHSRNGPFALTGHMVQNPPYWMAKECSRFEHKGIPTCQAQLSFVFDVPVEDATFFCHPVWRILYHVTS